MQPVQVQSPPARSDSISAVRAPRVAAMPAATSPAAPAPSPIDLGSRPGFARAESARRCRADRLLAHRVATRIVAAAPGIGTALVSQRLAAIDSAAPAGVRSLDAR